MPWPLSALLRVYPSVYKCLVSLCMNGLFSLFSASVSVFFYFSFTYILPFHDNFLLSLPFYSLSSVLCSAVLFMSFCLRIFLCSFATFYPHYAVLLCLSSVLTFVSFYITVSPEWRLDFITSLLFASLLYFLCNSSNTVWSHSVFSSLAFFMIFLLLAYVNTLFDYFVLCVYSSPPNFSFHLSLTFVTVCLFVVLAGNPPSSLFFCSNSILF